MWSWTCSVRNRICSMRYVAHGMPTTTTTTLPPAAAATTTTPITTSTSTTTTSTTTTTTTTATSIWYTACSVPYAIRGDAVCGIGFAA